MAKRDSERVDERHVRTRRTTPILGGRRLLLRSPRRVLLVDGHTPNRQFVARLLTTHLPGMEIGHASSGSEALRLLVSEPYDLVIFELLLPEMSGIDFGAALRAADTHVPLLAITRQGGTDEWRALSKLGVHGCLLQPMDPLALAAAVCAAFMVG